MIFYKFSKSFKFIDNTYCVFNNLFFLNIYNLNNINKCKFLQY